MILDITDSEHQYLKRLLYWRLKHATNPYQEEFHRIARHGGK